MDIALGISMAPTAVRMTLVEGDNADGVTIEDDGFEVDPAETAPSAADQVVAAILGTREGAAEGGYQLTSTGVTWTDPAAAAALRRALAARKITDVMLVSAFLAAAALAQAVASAIDYAQIALLYVEPETATLAVVDADDGSVAEVHQRALGSADLTSELTAMIAELDGSQTHPEGLFVVGSGVDVAAIKPVLETTTRLPVSVPEEPDTALARGAALASANAPLFVASTAALAYSQDPGTGEVNPSLADYGYYEITADPGGAEQLAYSAVDDEDADATMTALSPAGADAARERRPWLSVGSVLAAVVAIVSLATVVSLAVTVRQTVALQPMPGQHLIVPAQQAPAPTPVARVSTPHPAVAHPSAPAAAPAVGHAVTLPAPVHPPAPALPAPALAAPLHPVPMPALAPVPIPLPVPLVVPPVQAPVLRPPATLPIVPKAPVPATTPLVHTPTPPVHTPLPATPPARLFTPPVHAPLPATPPAHTPLPATPAPLRLPAPAPVRPPAPAPLRLPAPAPFRPPVPAQLPTPAAPPLPSMPTPAIPRFGAPPMPAPIMPRMPMMPMPRFNFRIPAFRL